MMCRLVLRLILYRCLLSIYSQGVAQNVEGKKLEISHQVEFEAVPMNVNGAADSKPFFV